MERHRQNRSGWIGMVGFVGLLTWGIAAGLIGATEPPVPTTALTAEAEPESASSAALYFKEKVMPLLEQHCFDCHSHEAGEASGGLVLDSKTGWEVGGVSGPALVPFKPEASLLLRALHYEDVSLQMPPDGKLPDEAIQILTTWIRQGAVDPRGAGKAGDRPDLLALGRQWWSFQPLQVTPTAVAGSDLTAQIDRLLAAARQQHGMVSSPVAEPALLLRRLYYDLIGLPPTPPEVAHFEQQMAQFGPTSTDQAMAAPAPLVQVVDRLLASRQFAEKWGRHWLDLARYADSNGSSFNPPFHTAWRYRNWVIAALAEDMPIDEFLRKQIAGDLLPAADPETRDANLIATGFLMLGSKVLGNFDKEQLVLDVVDEQLDTIGKSMLGMTIGCARCHDHKFDPIPQTDYYALAGIMTSTVTLYDRLGGPKEDESDWSRRGLGPEGDLQLQQFLAEHRYDWVKTHNKLFYSRKQVDKLQQQLTEAEASQRAKRAGQLEKAQAELKQLEAKWSEYQAKLPAYALAVRDANQPQDTALRIRGVAASSGPIIPRGFLRAAHFSNQPMINPAQSGRLELADWLTDPRHPLTARVFVNRVWKHLFRTGIVRSVDNFGTTGDQPTHPELLDTVAAHFLSQGWHLKPLVRAIVLTRSYRLAVTAHAKTDPENQWLTHQNRRRLEPEEIRDTLLLLRRELDLSPGTGMVAQLPIGDVSNLEEVKRLGDSRRTIYQPVIRTLEPDINQLFDAANSAMPTGDRPKTIIAPQALYFLNSATVQATAADLAQQATEQLNLADPELVIQTLFQQIVCRQPNPGELAVLKDYLRRQHARHTSPSTHDLMKLCQTILASTQFQFLD